MKRFVATTSLLLGIALLAAACGTTTTPTSRRRPTPPRRRPPELPPRPPPPATAPTGASGDAGGMCRRQDARGRHAHHRHRQPGVPPVRDRRRTRVAARASRRPSRWPLPDELGFEGDAVTWVRTRFDEAIQPGAEELRLQPAAVLDHRRAQADRRLQRPVLHHQPGGRRLRGLRRRRRHDRRRPEGPEVRRPGRHDEPRVHHRRHPARRGAVRLRRQRRREGGARGQPDRRDRRRPADGVLHHAPSRSRARRSSASSRPRPAARPTSSACCSTRTTRSSTASTSRSPR